jgi:hypothetical protein
MLSQRALLICGLGFASALGQTPSSRLIPRTSAQSGALLQYWSTSDRGERLQEFVVPLVLHYAPNERFSVSLLNTPTHARYQSGGNASNLFAFSDTRLAAAWILGEERGVLNFGLSLPSGLTQLDPATELPVAEKITSHALAMPTSYFGGGVEASAGLALALQAGDWVLGASMTGVYHGSFTPIAGGAKYQPGPELAFALGFDRVLGEAHRLFGDVSYTWYGKDESEGQKIFQSDGKLAFSLASVWNYSSWQISWLAQNNFKRTSPFALSTSYSISYGNELEVSTEWARKYTANNAWLGLAELRLHAANNEDRGRATIFAFGPGWRGQISAPLQLQASTRLALGKLNDTKLWGVEVNVGAVYSIAR